MNKEDVVLLQNCSQIERIICDIRCIAVHGGSSWTGVIGEGLSEVIKYFKEHHFTVTSNKLSCLIVTISWNE